MARKLKVYRTPIGFHDAYVAAPSQKEALEAWGSDADLFARGVAEAVTDEALMREPLAHPGKVVRCSRGSVADQFAALPPDPPAHRAPRKSAEATQPAAERPRASRKAPKPRPSRAALDQAETALEALVKAQRAEDDALRQRERALARERRDLDRAHERDRAEAERSLERTRAAHAAALARWRTDP